MKREHLKPITKEEQKTVKDVLKKDNSLYRNVIDTVFGEGTVKKIVHALENSILNTTNELHHSVKKKLKENLTEENDVQFDFSFQFTGKEDNKTKMTFLVQYKENGELKKTVLEEKKINIDRFNFSQFIIDKQKVFKQF